MEPEKPPSRKAWLNFLLPAGVLGSWGCLLIHFYTGGNLGLLQHPRFHITTAASGGLLILGALLYPLLRDPSPNVSTKKVFQTGVTSLLMLAPVVLAWLFPLNDYSPSDLTSLRAPQMAPSLRALKERPRWLSQETATPNLLEVLMAADDPAYRPELEGKRVTLLGQCMAPESTHFQLVRMMMFCCAADARPIALTVSGHSPEPGEWIHATGILHLTANGLILNLETAEPAAAPRDFFLY